MLISADATPEAADQILHEALRGRRLVFEAGLDGRSRDSLIALVEKASVSTGIRDLGRLAPKFPALFVAAVATEGVFAYSGGDLWSNLRLQRSSTEIGQAFSTSIAMLQLERFDVFDEQGAHRYVSRILAHAGVPEYCLRDLFRFLAAARGRGIAEAEEAIEMMSLESYWRQQLDRPVQRFLRDTGAVGRDFLQRVLELPEEHDSAESDLVVAERIGLPIHVVKAFRTESDTDVRSRGVQSPRLARPILRFDPDIQDAPELIISSGSGSTTSWRLIHEDGPTVAAQELDFLPGEELRFDVAPARRWRALAISEDGSQTHAYSIEGVAESRPLLVFDVESGNRAADPRFLPSTEVWVISPCPLVSVDEKLSILSVTELRGAAWQGWLAHDVIVNGTGELRGNHHLQPVSLRLGTEERVRVRVGNLDPIARSSTGHAVLSGPPVLLEVPWSESDSDRWQVVISGSAIPDARLPATADIESLNHELSALFAVDAISDFTLRLQGPIGAQFRLDGVVVPGLSISIPDALLFPGDQSTVQIAVAAGLAVLHDGVPGRSIVVDGSMPRVILDVMGSNKVIAQLSFRIGALGWRLIHRKGLPTRFGNVPIRQPVDQTGEMTLVLEIDVGDASGVSVATEDTSGVRVAILPVSRRKGSLLRIDLAPAVERLRSTDALMLTVGAEIDGRHQRLVELNESVSITLVGIRHLETNAGPFLDYEIEQSKAVANCAVRVWSVDRPWNPAVTLRLAGGALAGRVSCGRLLPGMYRAEAGVEAGAGPLHSSGAPPLNFEIPWSDKHCPDDQGDADEREVLVRAVRLPDYTAPVIADRMLVAPAAVLLLGSPDCDSAAARRVAAAITLSIDEGIVALDTAAKRYGLTSSAAVRATLRILLSSGRESSGDFAEGTFASRLLRLVAARPYAAGQSNADSSMALAGITLPASMNPESILGTAAKAVPAARILADLREIERVPAAPLSLNGRALGLFQVRVWAHAKPEWIAQLAGSFSIGREDVEIFPLSIRQVCFAARNSLPKTYFPDGMPTLHLHVLSLEAAAHVVCDTPRAPAAIDHLVSVARTFPAYVETRLIYLLLRRRGQLTG